MGRVDTGFGGVFTDAVRQGFYGGGFDAGEDERAPASGEAAGNFIEAAGDLGGGLGPGVFFQWEVTVDERHLASVLGQEFVVEQEERLCGHHGLGALSGGLRRIEPRGWLGKNKIRFGKNL